MFERLDLDGDGTIDYTEFCAAGIGERMSTEEDVLRAAKRFQATPVPASGIAIGPRGILVKRFTPPRRSA